MFKVSQSLEGGITRDGDGDGDGVSAVSCRVTKRLKSMVDEAIQLQSGVRCTITDNVWSLDELTAVAVGASVTRSYTLFVVGEDRTYMLSGSGVKAT